MTASSPVQAWLDQEDDSWRPLVSFFRPPVRNTLPSESLSLWEVHNRITCEAYRDFTHQLRSLSDPKEIRALKASSFAYVTFAGTFSSRNDRNLLQGSDLLVLDFDHLPDPERVKQQLLQDEYFDTEMLFLSPSGTGLKWVIRRDPGSRHQEYFRAVENYLQRSYHLTVDPSGRDVSRACFLTFDENSVLHERHNPIMNSEL